MRTVFLLLVVTISAMADSPHYFGKLKGVVVLGLMDRGTFEFSPGKTGDCESKSTEPPFKIESFNCPAVNGASVKFADEKGKAVTLLFSKLYVMYKWQRSGDVVREYRFSGEFSDPTGQVALQSRATFVLWYYLSQPTRINGFIELPQYSLSAAIQATVP